MNRILITAAAILGLIPSFLLNAQQPGSPTISVSTETVLHSFDPNTNTKANGGLIQGRDGNFYGTTSGGSNGFGAVFKITPQGKETELYRFGAVANDGSYGYGAYPASLIQGSDGNLYGTTAYGGSGKDEYGYSGGTFFKVTLQGDETILYSFGSVANDGMDPTGGLIQGKDGNFYGMTSGGGNQYGVTGVGTVFKITPEGKETVLYRFGSVANDGTYPTGGLIQGKDGNFYGMTPSGGSGPNQYSGSGSGTVFKITPQGKETILHSFGTVATDGIIPTGGLIQGKDGNFYGTTAYGGVGQDKYGDIGVGTVFKITPQGKETVLYSFGTVANDGIFPACGLVQGSDGNFYGTTASGGLGAVPLYGAGTIFKLGTDGVESVVANFGTLFMDTAVPNSALIQGSDGNFYGTTDYAVFKFTPNLPVLPPTFPAVLEAGQPFTINPSTYGLASPYQNMTVLPSWISYNPQTGIFTGTAPDQPGGRLGQLQVTGNENGGPLPISIDLLLVNNVDGSGVFGTDVGDVAHSGSAEISSSGNFTITASGNGIGVGGPEDGYHIVYVPVTGDFTLIAQVDFQFGGGETGIVAKDSLEASSSFIGVMVQSGGSTTAEYAFGSVPASILGQDVSVATLPAKLKLVRSGDTFSQYEWTGSSWQQLGTIDLPGVASTLYVGMVESADSNSTSATGVVSHVLLLPSAQ